jgi:hypothetical protein
VLLVVALAGCGQPATNTGSPGLAATSPGPPPGSAATSPGPPLNPPPMDPTPSGRADCVASTEEATARKNEAPGQICLIVGATLHVSSQPSPRSPWQPLSSSDSKLLACTSTKGTDGTIDGTCRALRPGTVVLTTATSPVQGDTRYSPDYLWQLTVRIVA